ncbi:MAG TPA: nitroreductase family protein [Bacillota bacterium]|nr:nitroreductase family protein [Bacillota bacterium]
MEFTEVITQRRAIRHYKSDPIPSEKMAKLYEALQLAPSGNNRQPYRFYFVTDPEKRREIVTQACHQEFILEAPVIMVATCERGDDFNVAIAVDHLILAAVNEGLGTCWVGWFEREAVRQILDIPETQDIPILVPIGYPAQNPAPRPRKPISELIIQV